MNRLTPQERALVRRLEQQLVNEQAGILHEKVGLRNRLWQLNRNFNRVRERLAVCRDFLHGAHVGDWPDWFTEAVTKTRNES